MITHDNIVSFIRDRLTTFFESPYDEQTGEPLGQYSDFVDNMEIYQESSVASKKDIIITVQFLPGTTQLGVTDLPINLIFEVIEGKATNDKTMANQVMDLVNTFVEDYNDTETPMVDDNSTTYVVKQYYASSHALGNGQARGTNKYKAFNVEMRLIIYENGYFSTLQENEITFDNTELNNILSVDTLIQQERKGYTANANPFEKLKLAKIRYQLTISYIATKNDALHTSIASNALADMSYAVVHTGFVTRSATMRIVEYVESTPYADVCKCRLTLVKEG